MQWREIPGFSGREMSDEGAMRYGGTLVKGTVRQKDGRLYYGITMHDVRYANSAGHWVLLAFVGPPGERQECRHLDGDCTNNKLVNLAWGSHAENMQDAVRHGTHKSLRLGDANSVTKIPDAVATMIANNPEWAARQQNYIAKELGVSVTAIRYIRKGHRRSHLKITN